MKHVDWQLYGQVGFSEKRTVSRMHAVKIGRDGGAVGYFVNTALAHQAVTAVNAHAALKARVEVLEKALRGCFRELTRIGNAPAVDHCEQHWDADTDAVLATASAALETPQ